MFKSFSRVFLCYSLAFLTSCSNDDESTPSYADAGDYEVLVFEKLSKIAPEASTLWQGYDFVSSHPAYIILTDNDLVPVTGYLINAPEALTAGSLQVSPEESFGYAIYQSNDYFTQAEESLEGGLFTFDLELEGTTFFAMKAHVFDNFYNNYKNQNDNFVPLVVTHEMFHMYQFAHWTLPEEWVQDFNGYPLDEEQIALHLLLYELMKRAYFLETDEERETYLKYYVSIRHEMIRKDETEAQLVTNMGTYQELIEGTARYVEHFSALNSIFPEINDDPTHGWEGFLNDVADQGGLRLSLATRIWYHVGAAATHLNKSAGANTEALYAQGLTPYQVAFQQVQLTEEELQSVLSEATSLVDWAAMQARAAELASLP